MIVQPDFLDHWKTRMLVDLLNDPLAPMYVIRLWGYCQTRKTHRFPVGNPAKLKAICHAAFEDAEGFEDALLTSGFLEKTAEEWVVHEWDEVNYYLINSWENGKKGGRPQKETQKKPARNLRLSDGIPEDIPTDTDSEPMGGAIREEKRREEKIREEREDAPAPGETSSEEEDLTTLAGCLKALLALSPAWRSEKVRASVSNSLRICPSDTARAKAVAEFLDEMNALEELPAGFPIPRLRGYMRNAAEKINGTPSDDADDAWRKKLKRGFRQG